MSKYIHTYIHCQLPDLPTCINEQLTKLCFPLNPSCHVRVINTCVHTLMSSNELMGSFKSELYCIVKATPLATRFACWVNSMPESVMTLETGKGYWDTMVLEKWTLTAHYYWMCVQKIIWPLPIPFSGRQTNTRQPGCTPDPNKVGHPWCQNHQDHVLSRILDWPLTSQIHCHIAHCPKAMQEAKEHQAFINTGKLKHTGHHNQFTVWMTN